MRRTSRPPQSRLLVEMLEDRRVLSTLGGLLEAPVAAASAAAAAAASQLEAVTNNAVTSLADLVSKPVRSEQGPPDHVAERLLDKLPEHVIPKHPLLNDVVDNAPNLPDPVDDAGPVTNPGNGNGGGNSGNTNPGNGNPTNPGNGNPTNPGNGNPTRPDTPPTLPTPSTPSGPEPGAVDAPGNTARPDAPEVAGSVADLKLTFTPDGVDANGRTDAVSNSPAGPNQPSGAASATATADAGASTRLVQESAEAGVRPTADAALAEDDDATAELLQQIAYLEATAAGATAVPGELQGADLASLTGGGIDLRALDEALRQAVATVERAGQAVAQSVAQPGFATWIVGSIGSLLALEGMRRARRRRARMAGALADDPALTWVPGMPGSFSIDEDA
jgi:hypothetical protein